MPYEVGGNRLRTALVALRKALAPNPPIDADRNTMRLDRDRIALDLDEAAEWEARSKLAPDLAAEREGLDHLMALIGPGLLAGWEEEWLANDQLEWRIRRHDAQLRAAELALQAQDYENARRLAEELIVENPADGFAWSPFLIASARLGAAKAALRRFQTSRATLRADGQDDFDPALVQLARAVRSGAYAPTENMPGLPAGIDATIVQAFRRLVPMDPGLAVKFVCSDAFRLESLRAPQPGVVLLEHLLREGHAEGADDVALRLMTLRTHSLLHGVERVLELGVPLLEEPLEPAQRRLVLTLLSYSHFMIRDLDRAFHFVDRAIEVADRHSPPHHRHLTRADRALYVWHRGRGDDALELLRTVYEATKDESEALVSYAPAYLCGLIGTIHAMTGEFLDARDWLHRGYAGAKIRQYREQVHQIEPAYAYVLAADGHVAKAARLAVSGLGHFVQSGNVRAFAASLDFIAGVFAHSFNAPMAWDCLEWGRTCRQRFQHGRTVAESRFAERIIESFGGVPSAGLMQKAATPLEAFEIIAKELSLSVRSARTQEPLAEN